MERTNWHRLFGLLLTDFFVGSPFTVELEKDLSLIKQLLDVVVVRAGRGRLSILLPDGLDKLAKHNLITFKSFQEALDDWVLKELTGHYVNYRKWVSREFDVLLPEAEFQLYAVCSRYPRGLASVVPLRVLQDGVYECERGTDVIRVVVAKELPKTKNNALLHLLSAAPDQIRYGAEHYRQRSAQTSTLLDQLFEGYQREGLTMPYTMDDFRRDYLKQHIKELTLQERLEGITLQERLEGVSPEELQQVLNEIKAGPQHRKQESGSRKRKKK